MIPGPFEICFAESREDTDAFNYKSLSFGYDSVEEAREAMPEIAREKEVHIDDLCVIRVWANGDPVSDD